MGIFGGRRPSRAEKQVRNLCRGLFWVSIILLVVTISMTGRFGWNLGVTYSDKFLYAIGNGAVDVVGALIMAGCGVCIARRSYIAGTLAGLGAVVCILLSGFAIFGFLASNRTAVAKHIAKIEATDAGQLDWLRNQTMAKGHNTQQKETFFVGVKEQIREIKSALPQLPDAQAEDLAKLAGIPEEDMRRWLTLLGTGAILFCQFACLGLYGYIRQRIEPDLADAGKGEPTSPVLLEPKRKQNRRLTPFNAEAAREDLLKLLADGHPIPSQAWLGKRWGCSDAAVSQRLNRWQIERERAGVGQPNRIIANGYAKEG